MTCDNSNPEHTRRACACYVPAVEPPKPKPKAFIATTDDAKSPDTSRHLRSRIANFTNPRGGSPVSCARHGTLCDGTCSRSTYRRPLPTLPYAVRQTVREATREALRETAHRAVVEHAADSILQLPRVIFDFVRGRRP